MEPPARNGTTISVSAASRASSTNRITSVPISVSDDWISVTAPSVTSWSSASTSLVIRDTSTPARRRE